MDVGVHRANRAILDQVAFKLSLVKRMLEQRLTKGHLENRTGRLSFLLDTNTGELRFTSEKPVVSTSQEDESRETEMWTAAA
jgi:hypothetical protein